MALLATDGSVLNANRPLCQMLGYSIKELRSLNLDAITHPDDVGTEIEQRHRLASSDISRYELVQRCVRKDRTVMWIRLSVAATRTASGGLVYFVAQLESVPSHYLPHQHEFAEADLSGFKDSAHAAMHEIANSLTPLMLNTEMLVEQSAGSQVRESAHEIFKAARRIAFALRRVWGIEDVEPVAYVGESRMLDLRLVAPPVDHRADDTVEPRLKVM
jgi:PAS domain S-box-containing protein